MSLKELLREKAFEIGFEDVGFTGVEPFDLYIKEIRIYPKTRSLLPELPILHWLRFWVWTMTIYKQDLASYFLYFPQECV